MKNHFFQPIRINVYCGKIDLLRVFQTVIEEITMAKSIKGTNIANIANIAIIANIIKHNNHLNISYAIHLKIY